MSDNPSPTPPEDHPEGARRPVIKKRVGRKQRQEELEQPDEFMEVGGTIVDWVVANLKPVMMVVGGILLGLALWGVLQSMDRGKREEASAALYEATKLLPGDTATTTFSLSTSGTGDDDEEAKTLEAVTALDAVVVEFGSTPQAAMAQVEAGNALFRIARYEEALTHFEAAAAAEGLLGDFAVSSKGYALEALDRHDEAINTFEGLRARLQGEQREQPTIDLARIHETKGDYDRARALYAEFETEFENSLLLPEVQARSAAIAAL